MAERKKIGELLVEGKVITPTQLSSALSHQRQWGGRLGSALIEKGFLTEDVLAKFLSFQLNFPSVSLTKIQIQQDVLARVPRDMQEKHLCVPIAVMKEGRTSSLILAIADPTDVRAIDEIGFATGLKVKPVIATESALKKVLYGAQTGGVRNVALATPSGFRTVNERTDEFEVVRGVTNTGTGPSVAPIVEPAIEGSQPQALGVVGEETIDFGESDVVLAGEEVEPSPAVVSGTIAPPSPPVAAGKPDPFAAAVIARATGAPAPATPAPTPMVMGTPIATGPIPGGPPVIEGSLPTLDPAALAPVTTSLPPSADGAVPSNGFETEDRTEPDIVMAGGSPPAIPEPEPEPEPAAQPEAEALPADETSALLDAWGEPPPPPPEEIIATGAIPTEEGMPEISLPGPEMLPPPAEIMESPAPERPPVDTPSRIFRVPEDMPMAESSLQMPEAAPAAAPAVMEDEAWAPAAESWEPAPETWAAEPAAEPVAEQPADAPAGATFDPGMESGFEPTVPDSEMEAPPPVTSLDPPSEMLPPETMTAGSASVIPSEESVALPVEDTFVPGAAPPAEPSIDPLAADGGAMPQSLDPAMGPDDNEKTVIGMGAMEPTWTGEKPLPERQPEKTVLGLGASQPLWTDPEHAPETTTEDRPVPNRAPPEPDRETASDRETIESFELPPPKPVPPPAVKLEPPKPAAPPPVVPTPPSQEKTFLKPPAVKVDAPEAAESSEPSRPPAPAAGLSDEQAALNVTITKKLKLLNAIAELLLEKGLISEDEIKEKIAKKK